MSILVVSAHPDDEVLGCGGTIARYALEGEAVHVLILGEGITSRCGLNSTQQTGEVEALHRQADQAGAILGVERVTVETFPDNRFDTVPMLDVVQLIEKKIASVEPTVVFCQHGGDLNVDHQVTSQACLTAVRPMAGSPVNALYGYEVPSSTEWAFRSFEPEFRPVRFVDVGETLERKLRAMACYQGEVREFPHPRSERAIRALSEYRGAQVGCAAAEAFDVVFERV